MFINILFLLGSDRLAGLLTFVIALLLSQASLLTFFVGKHSCLSLPFRTAILNGTSFLLSLVQEKLNMPSGHYYRHCS